MLCVNQTGMDGIEQVEDDHSKGRQTEPVRPAKKSKNRRKTGKMLGKKIVKSSQTKCNEKMINKRAKQKTVERWWTP